MSWCWVSGGVGGVFGTDGGRFLPPGWSIDCYKCVSIGGNNVECDDPFHNNGSTDFLESPCMGGRKGRDGMFPATACVKIVGNFGTVFFSFSSYIRSTLVFCCEVFVILKLSSKSRLI